MRHQKFQKPIKFKPGEYFQVCSETQSVAQKYLNARPFIEELKKHEGSVKYADHKRLREMALSGKIDEAFYELRLLVIGE